MSVTFQPEPTQRPDQSWDMHDSAPRLNVNGRNADLIFEQLGVYRDPWGGSLDATDLLRRAMRVANRDRGDEGRSGTDDGRWVEGPVPEGYLARSLGELMGVARAAIDLGVDVQWG